MNPLWENNELQFARLLCEIVATQDLDMAALCESMDLEPDDLDDLLERANSVWEQAKEDLPVVILDPEGT